jgi:hypothetical protein
MGRNQTRAHLLASLDYNRIGGEYLTDGDKCSFDDGAFEVEIRLRTPDEQSGKGVNP